MELQTRNATKTCASNVQAIGGNGLPVAPVMLGLPGPDGAGKSSLMRTIATLQEPDAGTVHRGDIDVVRQMDELRCNPGYLPQELGVRWRPTAEAAGDMTRRSR